MPTKHGFLRLVKERHDPTLTQEHVCPYCGSENIKHGGGITTAMGGFYNHTAYHCHCRDCGKGFDHHWKEEGKHWETGEVREIHWYQNTVTGKVLKGIPAAFTASVWTCKHCGGDVVVHDLPNAGRFISGEPERDRHKFFCEGCERSALSVRYCYQLPRKPGPKRKPDPNAKPLMIYEVPGLTLVNPKALERLK